MKTSDRPEILTFLGSYVPGYKAGGPVRSIQNLTDALSDEFRFKIMALDHDYGDSDPYPGVVTNQWVPVGEAEVMYLSSGLKGFLKQLSVLRNVGPHTVVYLNSFLTRRFSMLAVLMIWLRLCNPRSLIIAPRGEFSSGSLSLKPRRKRLFMSLARHLRPYQTCIWHVSSGHEADNLRRVFRDSRIAVAGVVPGSNEQTRHRTGSVVVASDLGASPPTSTAREYPKSKGELRAIFVSRVSPEKNLASAIRMLAGLSGKVSFDIVGPLENAAYWRECEKLISQLPPNVSVHYRGQVEHRDVFQAIAECHLFLFPSLGESYGHVISEALLAGCPVLISDQTPWRDLEKAGVGWVLPLSEADEFNRVLQRVIDMGPEEHADMSRRASNYARERVADAKVVEANRFLFRLAAGSCRP